MKPIVSTMKKVVVEYPGEVEQYLDSSYNSIRFGSTCCLTSALRYWDIQTVKKTVEQISAAGKNAEFQTFILPHSKEHVEYMDRCFGVLRSFTEDCMPLVVISDIGFIDIKYPKKCASHFFKIKNKEDVSLLADFGFSDIDIVIDSETSIEDVMAFIYCAHEHALRVGVVDGISPIFLGWRCYFDALSKKSECNTECKNTLIPLFSPSESEASFYIAGKSIYPKTSLKIIDLEKLSPDAIISYVSKQKTVNFKKLTNKMDNS